MSCGFRNAPFVSPPPSLSSLAQGEVAAAASQSALSSGAAAAAAALSSFDGVKRRFELVGCVPLPTPLSSSAAGEGKRQGSEESPSASASPPSSSSSSAEGMVYIYDDYAHHPSEVRTEGGLSCIC